jgi:hypothetical protein
LHDIEKISEERDSDFFNDEKAVKDLEDYLDTSNTKRFETDEIIKY